MRFENRTYQEGKKGYRLLTYYTKNGDNYTATGKTETVLVKKAEENLSTGISYDADYFNKITDDIIDSINNSMATTKRNDDGSIVWQPEETQITFERTLISSLNSDNKTHSYIGPITINNSFNQKCYYLSINPNITWQWSSTDTYKNYVALELDFRTSPNIEDNNIAFSLIFNGENTDKTITDKQYIYNQVFDALGTKTFYLTVTMYDLPSLPAIRNAPISAKITCTQLKTQIEQKEKVERGDL